MARTQRRSRRPAIQALLALAGLLLFFGAYAAIMQWTVDSVGSGARADAAGRDNLYAAVHLGLLGLAAVAGFGLGKWLNGLGIAYAVLFVVVLAVSMVMAQFASQALACNGHNDILRHWTCTGR